MRAKIYCILIALIVVLLAQGISAADGLSWAVLPNCEAAGISADICDKVVGPVYKSSVEGDSPFEIKIELPMPNFKYSRDWVNCKSIDNTVIAGAYYNKENNEWAVLPTDVDIKPDGTIFLNITTTKMGIIAVVTTERCVPVSCGMLSSFNTDPFGAKAILGKAITFIFCGIVPGCDLSPIKWTPSCTFPEPVIGQELTPCTTNGGDCCMALKDGICDTDCWPAPGSEEVKHLDYVDPDCMNLKDNPGCYRNKIDTDSQNIEKCDKNCGDTDYVCNVTKKIECTSAAGNCCNPSIDGECDADCPNITAADNKDYYLDPDCGILRNMNPTQQAGDGCYPICDGICDSDCMPGIDLDCLSCPRNKVARVVFIDSEGPCDDCDGFCYKSCLGPMMSKDDDCKPSNDCALEKLQGSCCIRDGDGICDNSMEFADKFAELKKEYEEKAKAAEESPEEQGLREEEKAQYAALSALYYELASSYTLETPENAPKDCGAPG